MGTRSIILVTGKRVHSDTNFDTVRLYRHWDGNPNSNLDSILKAIKQSKLLNKLPSWELTSLPATTMADLIIANSIGWSGAATRIDDDSGKECIFHAPLEERHYGNQGDLKWMYVVDISKQTITVYAGDYEPPQAMVGRGAVDPMSYADQLLEDYRSDCRTHIAALMDQIIEEGWFIASPPLPVPERRSRRKKESIANVS